MRSMMLLTIALLAGAMFGGSNASAAGSNTMTTCAASWKTTSPTAKAATTYKTYMSSCMKGGSATGTSAMSAAPAAAPAPAKTASGGNTMSACAGNWKTKSDADKKATTYKAFMSGCMKGTSTASAPAVAAAAPAAVKASPQKPATQTVAAAPKKAASPGGSSKILTEGNTGTSARCKDGAIIQIKSHAGACSHHGGVAAWR